MTHFTAAFPPSPSTTSSRPLSLFDVSRTTSMTSIESTRSLPEATNAATSSEKSSPLKRTSDQESSLSSPTKIRKVSDNQQQNTAKTCTSHTAFDDVFSTSSSSSPHKGLFASVSSTIATQRVSTSAVESSPRLSHLTSGASTLENLIDAKHGSHLDTHFIVKPIGDIQSLMDSKEIAGGTQWQLALGVSLKLWTWKDVEPKLDLLRGSNAQAAYRVFSVMLNQPLSKDLDLSLWDELDREQKAIMENKGRGLGLMGTWEGVADYYGGRIQQSVHMIKRDGKIMFELQPLEMSRSTRIARDLGSSRIIALKVAEDLIRYQENTVRQLVSGKFVFCGRVFIATPPKDKTLYLIETNSTEFRASYEYCGDHFRPSFDEVVLRYNPLHLNYNQVCSPVFGMPKF